MEDANVQHAALKATVDAGFAAVNRRLDDAQVRSTERHAENVERLVRIETEARTTNGRVTRAEEQIRTLFARPKSKGDTLTLAELKWYLVIAGASVGGTVTVLQFLHLLK